MVEQVTMNNVENVDKNSQRSHEITSLSGGMEILPGMQSEKLYFKPIIYPEKWDQYKGSRQMNIMNEYFLEIANSGTDDPSKLYYIMEAFSDDIETYNMNMDDSYYTIECMIYARIVELGFWKANFVTGFFMTKHEDILEPRAKCLIYNESPVPLQMLPIASFYIDLLRAIENGEEEIALEFWPGFSDFYAAHPQILSAMVEEIKNEPFPTTKYLSWAFEKASHNLEAQKCWPFGHSF